MISLETRRLLLRSYEWKHLQALHEILSDPVTMKFWPAPFSIEQTREWIGRSMELYTSGFGRLGIFRKDNGFLIGDAGLRVVNIDGRQENDLGYIIKAKYWGQGYGKEAAAAVFNYGLHTLKLQRICANMPVDHFGSIKVAARLGMVLKREFLNQRNRNIRTYLYIYDVLANKRSEGYAEDQE
ncbi:hypothetical protein BBD40_23605 [Paenibacillus ihbetae]|uniref:N-acetyltransferase domain-containing protein n=1 Tax=Paenibacillus ihbetae TaxID=1870820 RepID=A0ABX3JRK4_9BACL|nr:GNAT family N-acetyltransferase [Paenibacillus ihbetae]OOC58683.1 hypothetical protein BBD40_23605 [Paenibacillus ihbetae]